MFAVILTLYISSWDEENVTLRGKIKRRRDKGRGWEMTENP